MAKTWEFQLSGQSHTVIVDTDWLNRRSFYFDGYLMYKESYIEAQGKHWQQQFEGEITIYSFEEYDYEFSIRKRGTFRTELKLYIGGQDADIVTRFYSPVYSQQNNTEFTSSPNTHTFFKDIIVPLVVALLGGGGILGLIKSCQQQELTPPTYTVNTPENTATAPENNSVCRLQSGGYKAAVTRDKGLGLRAKPLERDTVIKRINLNQEIIVLRENNDGSWRYVCLEGTSIEGWVIGKYTKKHSNQVIFRMMLFFTFSSCRLGFVPQPNLRWLRFLALTEPYWRLNRIITCNRQDWIDFCRQITNYELRITNYFSLHYFLQN